MTSFRFIGMVAMVLLLPRFAVGQPAEQTIRVSTRLVLVDAQILNKKTGCAIDGLSSEDFLLYEDGVLQKVTNFSRDKLALSVVLLFDVTWSLHPVIQQLALGAQNALLHLKPEDQVAVMAFGGTALLIEDFTLDWQKTVAAIQYVSEHWRDIEASVRPVAHLNEGVFQAALHSKNASSRSNRRVVVVLNDGYANVPRGNVHTEAEAFAEVFESGDVVCALVTRSLRSKIFGPIITVHPALALMRRLRPPGSVFSYAKQTGGEVVKVSALDADVKLAQTFDRLRLYYTLGYISSNPKLDGRFRTIKVRLKPEVAEREGVDIAIIAKQGYYASADGGVMK